MTQEQKRMATRMRKDQGYKVLETTGIPGCLCLARDSERNPIVYINGEGVVFKPYWLWK